MTGAGHRVSSNLICRVAAASLTTWPALLLLKTEGRVLFALLRRYLLELDTCREEADHTASTTSAWDDLAI
jgi:hypothetical protein